MNRAEIRVVKRQLEGYLDYLELAKQAEEKAEELEKRYEAMAGLRCMPLSKNDSGKNTGMKSGHTSRFLEIFDQQDELLQTAKQHRCRALRTRHFIEEVVEPLDKTRYEYFRLAYLNGVSYQSIGQRLGVPAATIKMGITRCLQQIPAYQARRFGIL